MVVQKFLTEMTRQAGAIVGRRFGQVNVKYTKEHPADVVTEADLAANRFLVRAIKKKFPDHGIVSEEQPAWQPDAEYQWIIDPLDGTRNFATRTPLFGVMVAVARHGVLEHAAVAIPPEHKLYLARRGGGAVCNGQRIRCSATRRWPYSYGCTGASLRPAKVAPLTRLIRSAAKTPFWLSMLGSSAVGAAYVADGRRDWLAGLGGAVWDYAAPALLLREAGCVVTNRAGEPWTLPDQQLLAAPPGLHGRLVALVGKRA